MHAARASSGFKILSRVGFATKGVVYLIAGVLAVMAAMGEGGKVQGSRGTIQTIGQQPFGQVLLWLVAVGLGGYALWRLVSVVTGPGGEASAAKSAIARIGCLLSGLAYAALAVAAVQMTMAGENGSRKTWLAQLMQQDYGPALIGFIGVAAIVAGAFQIKKAATASFQDDLEAPPKTKSLVVKLGRIGLAARGVVLPIVGFFLVKAALTADPSKFKGVGGVLRTLSQESYGTILLGAVAVGLAAYGAFMIACAKYKSVQA